LGTPTAGACPKILIDFLFKNEGFLLVVGAALVLVHFYLFPLDFMDGASLDRVGRLVQVTPVFGLYAHIPFCVHRCSYCDFYSSTEGSPEAFKLIGEKIAWEAEAAAAWMKVQGPVGPVTSVFFGGGTPSLMPLDGLVQLFSKVQSSFAVPESAEVTIEANPETVTPAFVEGLRERTSVNRVSLGAQSFQSKHLETLERRGSAKSIRNAARMLAERGIRNYSLDLIFGIPGQSLEDLFKDIDELAALEPTHLSFYSLTLKPGHKLYSGLPSDDVAADLYERGQERLKSYGYTAYEISNFSKPGFECRHNLLYWSGGDFLGFGPSSSSRLFREGVFQHRKQVSQWEKYLQVAAFPSPEFDLTTKNQTVLEACFLELRKKAGIDLAEFGSRYGYSLEGATQCQSLVVAGLIEKDQGMLRLTPRGWLLAEGVAAKLVD
jgi:oxygen-independent coproporphyrinogen III oxidase